MLLFTNKISLNPAFKTKVSLINEPLNLCVRAGNLESLYQNYKKLISNVGIKALILIHKKSNIYYFHFFIFLQLSKYLCPTNDNILFEVLFIKNWFLYVKTFFVLFYIWFVLCSYHNYFILTVLYTFYHVKKSNALFQYKYSDTKLFLLIRPRIFSSMLSLYSVSVTNVCMYVHKLCLLKKVLVS